MYKWIIAILQWINIARTDLSAINFAALKQRGIKGVILDKDNTITAPYQYHVHPDCQVRASLRHSVNWRVIS